MQQLLEFLRIHAQQGLFAVDQAFVGHFHRGAHPGGGVHLAIAGLQAVEGAVLDGVFIILHFPVMVLQAIAQIDELAVHLRHLVLHFLHRLRRADAGHHVLALGVDQVFAVHDVLAGSRVAGEADAGGAVAAHVAEHHGADVDRRTVGHVRGDMKFTPVVDGAFAQPGVEHRPDGDLQLFIDVGGEGVAGFMTHHLQEDLADFPEMVGGQADVGLHAFAFLQLLEGFVEFLIVNTQRHLAEQLDEAAVGVIAKALVASLPDQAGKGFGIQAEVEDGVHHAGHGHRRTRAHRYQQRIFRVTEALAGRLLQVPDLLLHLVAQPVRRGAVRGVQVGQAGIGGDDETRRHIEADLGHFTQVGALAAEQLLVVTVSLAEGKDILLEFGICIHFKA